MAAAPRVLLVRDPRHNHDPAGGDIILAALTSAGIEATLTEDVSAVSHLSDGKFDVVALYTQGDTFDPAQVEALTRFVREGNGLLGIHTAAATNKTDDAYAKLIGSRFIGHGPVSEFDVRVSDPKHVMARGIDDFRVMDELYLLKRFDRFQIFLTASSKDAEQPMGYTKAEGKGRVVYLANGHDPRSLNHPMVQELIVRGARYAAG